ncbi:hypothetical protein PIROE2DRAFT_16662 [Piromyces sp. E2]|nr:hypothetical protein PIROE2DRAFT_16662 [Piromyces sp. E2]|eukprot:OUM58144.1 hypothetical protein PIROE2DRAFT_16662 [Piromyces sp. E2]
MIKKLFKNINLTLESFKDQIEKNNLKVRNRYVGYIYFRCYCELNQGIYE